MVCYYFKEALLAILLAATISHAAPAVNNTLATRTSSTELERMKFIPWIPLRNLKDRMCKLYDPDNSLPKDVKKELEWEFKAFCCDKLEDFFYYGTIWGIPLTQCLDATPYYGYETTEAPQSPRNGKKDCSGVRREMSLCVVNKSGQKMVWHITAMHDIAYFAFNLNL